MSKTFTNSDHYSRVLFCSLTCKQDQRNIGLELSGRSLYEILSQTRFSLDDRVTIWFHYY